MINANVILDNSIWKKKIKNPNNYIKKKLKLLSKINIFKNKNQEFSILLTNNKVMKNLNNRFRKKNKPTDVLSFPLNFKKAKNLYLGDIALSYEIISRRGLKSNFFIEFDKMWVHGYFHLNGYDHKKLKDYKRMTKKENLVLNYFHK